jgi:hypothetical protein
LGGGEKSRERHVSRGKLLPRDRVHGLLDPGFPFLELGALAANGMYGNDAPGAGVVAGMARRLRLGDASGQTHMQVSGSTTAHFCWSTATVLLLGTSGPRRRQAPSARDIARDLLLLALSDIAVGMAAVTSHIVLAHVSDRRAWLLMLHLQRGDQRVFRLDCYTCAFAVGVGPDHVSRRHGINSHDRQRFWGATVWRRAS